MMTSANNGRMRAVEPEMPADPSAGEGSLERLRMLNQFFSANYKQLFRFLLKYVGGVQDADDLAQATYLEAATKIGGYRGESRLSTWVYGIALNIARNHRRLAVNRFIHVDDQVLVDLADGGDNAYDHLKARQAAARLRAAIDDLPTDMRDLVILIFFEEFSYEEAAAILNVPQGTVRSRLFRARKILAKRLEEGER